jgi:alpha-tubulin suppressor-like RCC1 family protein
MRTHSLLLGSLFAVTNLLASVAQANAATPTSCFAGASVTSSKTAYYHCKIDDAGAVWCWGDGTYGTLGGGKGAASTPIRLAAQPEPFTQVGAGFQLACGVGRSGSVYCWGWDYTTGGYAMMVPVRTSVAAVEVSVGYSSACAVLVDGTVECWGKNTARALGVETAKDAYGYYTDTWYWTPFKKPYLSGPATSVAVSGAGTCALLKSGKVECWGIGAGYGNASSPGAGAYLPQGTINPYVPAGAEGGVVQLAPGSAHMCARTYEGKAFCWGQDLGGTLGSSVEVEQWFPVAFEGVPGRIVDISAGYGFTCAVNDAGRVFCAGLNEGGILMADDDVTGKSLVAKEVVGFPGPVTRVSASVNSACATAAAGEIACWGKSWFGQLGTGDDAFDSPIPQAQAVSLPNTPTLGACSDGTVGNCSYRQISANAGTFCAVTKDSSEVRCWGDRSRGDTAVFHPSRVIGLDRPIREVATGTYAGCAVLDNGSVKCWGYMNPEVQATQSPTALPIAGLQSGVAGIFSGDQHFCAIKDDGTVWCFGRNDRYQLGSPTLSSDLTLANAKKVAGITDVVSGAANFASTCVVTRANVVRCWGDAAVLNDPTISVGSATPRAVKGLPATTTSKPTKIFMGPSNQCATTTDGRLFCWGDGSSHGFGTGAVTVSGSMKRVTAFPGVVTDVATNGDALCGRVGGDVYCMGTNANGMLGQAVSTDVLTTPARIAAPFPGGATLLAASSDQICAATGYDGEGGAGLWCWGPLTYATGSGFLFGADGQPSPGVGVPHKLACGFGGSGAPRQPVAPPAPTSCRLVPGAENFATEDFVRSAKGYYRNTFFLDRLLASPTPAAPGTMAVMTYEYPQSVPVRDAGGASPPTLTVTAAQIRSLITNTGLQEIEIVAFGHQFDSFLDQVTVSASAGATALPSDSTSSSGQVGGYVSIRNIKVVSGILRGDVSVTAFASGGGELNGPEVVSPAWYFDGTDIRNPMADNLSGKTAPKPATLGVNLESGISVSPVISTGSPAFPGGQWRSYRINAWGKKRSTPTAICAL